MKIPQKINDLFNECKDIRLNKYPLRYEVDFFLKNTDKKLFTCFKDVTLRIIGDSKFIQPIDKATKVIGQGFFKNGDNIVIISVFMFPGNGTYWEDDYISLCRHEISSDGTINYTQEHIDTLLLEDKNFKRVMSCPECTVIYYPSTCEFLCVKDSKKLGPKTKSDFDMNNDCLITCKLYQNDDALAKMFLLAKEGTSYIGDYTVVFPVLRKSGEEFTFHIMNTEEKESNVSNIMSVKINDVMYPVFRTSDDETFVYYLDSATSYNSIMPITSSAYDNEPYYIDKTPFGFHDILVINDDEAILKKSIIDLNDFSNYELYDDKFNSVLGTGVNLDKKLYILFTKMEPVKPAIMENKFPEYIKDEETYEFPTYFEAINFLNTVCFVDEDVDRPDEGFVDEDVDRPDEEFVDEELE